MAKKQAAVINPFDALAQAPKTSASKSKHPVAEVTPDVRLAVDEVISCKAEIKKKELELAEAETIVIDHVRPQQDAAARSGKFSKSFTVDGIIGTLTYTTSDKFSVPKDPIDQDHLKDLIGAAKFGELFTKVRNIALKPAVQENKELINKIVKAVTDAGITLADAFEVTDALKATKDMDVKQYELPGTQLDEFRTLVKQNKPALK